MSTSATATPQARWKDRKYLSKRVFPYVLRGPERERPGGYRQPRPLRMARKPEIRSPVWSGDIFSTYEDFRKQICAGLHMGLCGIPWWTTDIGGFHGGVTEDPDFQELLVRWFQFGTFCPVMRIHGNRRPREEIINKAGEVREGTGADNEVWSFGEKNYEILTKFIGVREKCAITREA